MKPSSMFVTAAIAGILTIAAIILTFLYYNYLAIQVLRYIGWAIWILAAFFGFMPIYTLRKKGLADTGLYAIMRHPQYFAWILLNISLIFIAQHWLVAVLAVISSILVYMVIIKEEQYNIKKFGYAYKQYMKKVPRINFILGIIRKLKSS